MIGSLTHLRAMSVLIPPALRPGDTIAIVPTARAITVGELREGIALAERWGLKVKLGAGIGRKHFQQAGTAEERAALDTGEVADWGRESWELARGLVYAKAFDRDPCAGGDAPKEVVWSDEDIEASLPTLRQRISQAGLRLARLLDGALSK